LAQNKQEGCAAMRSIIRLGFAVLLVVGGALFVRPAAVSAAPGGVHYSSTDCYEYERETVCYHYFGAYNETYTPSGNTLYNGYSVYSFTLTDQSGKIVESLRNTGHYHNLSQEELTRQLMILSTFETMRDGETCTVRGYYHVVGDQFQNRSTYSCH
jgi:hypothetical protein